MENYSQNNNNYLMGGNKKLLRDAYYEKLPKYIFEKKKTGFGLGLQNALEEEKTWLEKSIFQLNQNKFNSNLLNSRKNEAIKNYRKKNSKINFRKLWLFISLNEWNIRNDKIT